MGRHIKEKYTVKEVQTPKQLVNQSLNTIVTFQGKLPDEVDQNDVWASSPLYLGEDGIFYRDLLTLDGKKVKVPLKIAKVSPAIVHLPEKERKKAEIVYQAHKMHQGGEPQGPTKSPSELVTEALKGNESMSQQRVLKVVIPGSKKEEKNVEPQRKESENIYGDY